MTIAKTLHQRVILASLVLAFASLFFGFFEMKAQQEGFFVDTKYEVSAQLINAVTGFKTHELKFNRTGIVDHRVKFSAPYKSAQIFAVIMLAAMLVGAAGAVWPTKKGGALSAIMGAIGLVALYFVVQIEITPEELRSKGVLLTFQSGFYIAIVALIGYIIGGAMALTKGKLNFVAAEGKTKRFCGECGAAATNAVKFCGSCGSSIK